jgi:hypothetical protein
LYHWCGSDVCLPHIKWDINYRAGTFLVFNDYNHFYQLVSQQDLLQMVSDVQAAWNSPNAWHLCTFLPKDNVCIQCCSPHNYCTTPSEYYIHLCINLVVIFLFPWVSYMRVFFMKINQIEKRYRQTIYMYTSHLVITTYDKYINSYPDFRLNLAIWLVDIVLINFSAISY